MLLLQLEVWANDNFKCSTWGSTGTDEAYDLFSLSVMHGIIFAIIDIKQIIFLL